MIMNCLKCRAEADVSYHLKDDVAVCSLCGGTFEVTDYAKKMMKETGSIIKESSRRGFMFGCMNCSTEREVELKGDRATCKICGATINLPPAMLNALKQKVTFGDDNGVASDRPMIEMGRSTPKDVVIAAEAKQPGTPDAKKPAKKPAKKSAKKVKKSRKQKDA